MFDSVVINRISEEIQRHTDRMRGFIDADEEDRAPSEDKAPVGEAVHFKKNKLNGQRYFTNAVSALRNIIEDHKKISLFGLGWRYINAGALIGHRLFHKDEPLDYSKIINRQALFKTLTPFFQELVLGRLYLAQNPQDLSDIRDKGPLVREAVKQALKNMTFEQLKSAKEEPQAFFDVVFQETNRVFNDKVRRDEVNPPVWQWSKISLEGFMLQRQWDMPDFLVVGYNALRVLLSDNKIFGQQLQGSELQRQVTQASSDLLLRLPSGLSESKRPVVNNAFREIMMAEYPIKLSVWSRLKRIFGFGASASKNKMIHAAGGNKLIEVVGSNEPINFSQPPITFAGSVTSIDVLKDRNALIEQTQAKGSHSDRLGKILDRVHKLKM